MNLEPPTVFNTPVKIFIPCPYHQDVSNLNVYFYNGTKWVLAIDGDGTIQPGGEGWSAPADLSQSNQAYRINHNEGSPSAIEIKVYHFSGVQAGTTIVSSSSSGDGGGGGGGSCFIATVSSQPFDRLRASSQ